MKNLKINRKKYLTNRCQTSFGIHCENIYCAMLHKLVSNYVNSKEHVECFVYATVKNKTVKIIDLKLNQLVEKEIKRLIRIIDKVRVEDTVRKKKFNAMRKKNETR